ncbi:F-box domain containing protein, partial [Tanacetum coccineum]
NCTKLGRIAGNLVQLWVQFILGNGNGGTKVTEHPDSDSGKREFVSLMKFSVFTLQVELLTSIYQLDSSSGHMDELEPRIMKEQGTGNLESTVAQRRSQIEYERMGTKSKEFKKKSLDDDISDDDDPLSMILADSDVEDLIMMMIGFEKVFLMDDGARAWRDVWCDDPSSPLSYIIRLRGKGKAKPNLGGVVSRQEDPGKDRNQVLKDAVALIKGDRRDQYTYTSCAMRSEDGLESKDDIRAQRGKPDEYTDDEWEKYINFWNDPANVQRAETNRLNRSKSTVVSRHGSRSIPLTQHLMKMTSATQEEPSEIDTFYRLHTVNGVFQDPEALRMYDRMRELEATGEHTTAEINAMVRGGKLRGHIPGVGRFADAFARYDSGGASGSRARDRDDGDDTGGEDGGDDTSFGRFFRKNLEMPAVQADFFRKKSENAAVQAVYKKKFVDIFPCDMSLGKIPLGQNSEAK